MYNRRLPILRDGMTPRLAQSSTVDRGTRRSSAASAAVMTSAAVRKRSQTGCNGLRFWHDVPVRIGVEGVRRAEQVRPDLNGLPSCSLPGLHAALRFSAYGPSRTARHPRLIAVPTQEAL